MSPLDILVYENNLVLLESYREWCYSNLIKVVCRIGLIYQQLWITNESSKANLEKGINKDGILVTCYHQGLAIPLGSLKEYVLFFIFII